MPSTNHPARLTPEERRRRLAALLATGLVRLGKALVPPTSAADNTPENLPESVPNQLAESGQKSVTVSPVN